MFPHPRSRASQAIIAGQYEEREQRRIICGKQLDTVHPLQGESGVHSGDAGRYVLPCADRQQLHGIHDVVYPARLSAPYVHAMRKFQF